MATESSSPSCTVAELQDILKKGQESISMPQRPIDEVYDNVYVGGQASADNKASLQELGITHVLNCAQGTQSPDQSNYDDVNIKYCGIGVPDVPKSDVKPQFDTAAQFVDEALAQENGKVLIHCAMGFSRSASVAIAYLMMRKGMTVQEATRTVREKREVGPNSGFLEQLCALNEKK